MGWLSGWQHRKSHVINSASGAGTNYQVRVVAHYGSGADSGSDVYLNGKCRTDFGDVRFTGSDGATLLDYWMEGKVDGDYAVFWVEVADDLSSSNATIYVYYGKSDASTTSNGDNTFLLFDHFEGSSLNPTKWAEIAGNVQVANSEVTIWSTGSASKIRSGANWLYNVAVRMKTKFADAYDETGGLRLTASPFDSVIINRYSGGFAACTENEQNGTYTLFTWDANYHVYDLMWTSAKTKYYKDGNSLAEHTTNVPDENLYARFAVYGANAQIVVDWIAVRKYVDPEPSHGSWGSEEAALIIKQWSQMLDMAHVLSRPTRIMQLTQNLNTSHIFIRNRFTQLTQALQTLHAWTVALPEIILKQWTATLQLTHVFNRPVRVIKIPAALQLASRFSRPYRFIKLLQQLGLVREFYVSKPGVRKTRLFLVLGGLAIQLSND
ncbi:MAG: DUF2341 domain-containing protein [Candidatus Norongarragalinales archaeon]